MTFSNELFEKNDSHTLCFCLTPGFNIQDFLQIWLVRVSWFEKSKFLYTLVVHDTCCCVLVSQMFGRTIKASIAKDNGRATEFIRRKVYKDKSRCYECGVCICF